LRKAYLGLEFFVAMLGRQSDVWVHSQCRKTVID